MTHQRYTILKLNILSVLLLFTSFFAFPAHSDSVIVPIELDYPLLRHLMQQQLFNTADGSIEILQDPSGCSKIYLSDPRLKERQHRLEVTAQVRAGIGTGLFGSCARLMNWEGSAVFLAEPVIQPDARSLSLKIQDTRLYNPQGQLINSGPLWELAEDQLHAYLSRYRIDLAPSIDELAQLIPQLLNRYTAQQVKKIIGSLKLASIDVLPEAVNVQVGLQVDPLPASARPEAALSDQEMEQLEARWQMMDAMITQAVKQYAAATAQIELRDLLLEILLDARYQLRDALEQQEISHQEDPVRHWFIQSWQRLGPVLRRISLENPGQEPMLLVSLLTATNALAALDKLGPAVGLEISSDGLKRMGRMLIRQPGLDPLRYQDDVDPELRRLFSLPVSPQPTGSPRAGFDFWPIRSAWAQGSTERLHLWVPQKSELSSYLPEIRKLLLNVNQSSLRKNPLDSESAKVFRNLLLTTAWQESCWRQYVKKGNKVVPLRSNTGDAGLMQMNERVWRGFYDPQKLRWDIDYNARAGAEVLTQYLTKYALKRGEQKHSGGWDNLARATYSAYNGGPGQTSRYRDPKANPVHKKIDGAFWKKYQAVKQGHELQVAECLGGEAISLKQSSEVKQQSKPPPRRTVVSNRQVGKEWVMAQDKTHFTLQMAVFSSLKSAKKFRDDNKLQGTVAIAPLGKDKRGQYVVLIGNYASREEADRAKQKYPRHKPWIRQFNDIRSSIQ